MRADQRAMMEKQITMQNEQTKMAEDLTAIRKTLEDEDKSTPQMELDLAAIRASLEGKAECRQKCKLTYSTEEHVGGSASTFPGYHHLKGKDHIRKAFAYIFGNTTAS
ncbi:hypothetical protein TrVFT333_003665 [Trichoderma virens FT-333]|nr:hypothetical protein TrVFT333_003665 [Trichoderma virens FT-333]